MKHNNNNNNHNHNKEKIRDISIVRTSKKITDKTQGEGENGDLCVICKRNRASHAYPGWNNPKSTCTNPIPKHVLIFYRMCRSCGNLFEEESEKEILRRISENINLERRDFDDIVIGRVRDKIKNRGSK